MSLPVDITGKPIHPGDTVMLHAPDAAYAGCPPNVKPPRDPYGVVAGYAADGVVVFWPGPQRHDGFDRTDCRRFLEVKPAANTRRTAA